MRKCLCEYYEDIGVYFHRHALLSMLNVVANKRMGSCIYSMIPYQLRTSIDGSCHESPTSMGGTFSRAVTSRQLFKNLAASKVV